MKTVRRKRSLVLFFVMVLTFLTACQTMPIMDNTSNTESNAPSVITAHNPAEAHTAIIEEAESRKQTILTSDTDITYSGTAYYVSNSGNDANNGLSPESPWATLEKVNSAGQNGILKPGDAVFLERGGLWRSHLTCAVGVTYSAYGEGEKPKIYGSEENGTGSDKWELWCEEDGIKIWKYYRQIRGVTNIVFNDGEDYAICLYAYFNGTEWVNHGNDQTPFDMLDKLKQSDKTFYHAFDVDMERYNELIRNIGIAEIPLMDTTGSLYLRCDSGNPGELYHSIEFHMRPAGLDDLGLVTTAGDNVIDNLCIKYSALNGVAVVVNLNGDHGDNNVVQNCEIGWHGGEVNFLNSPDGGVMACGECIVYKTSNNIFRNNYIHQAACAGLVSEFIVNEWQETGEPMSKNCLIDGNIFEKCQYTLFFLPNAPDDNGDIVFWEDTTVSKNYVMYMGYGWSEDERYTSPAQPVNNYHEAGTNFAFNISSNAAGVKNFRAENNVFYLTKGGYLIYYPNMYEGDCDISFSGNTYAQNDNRNILPFNMSADSLSIDDIIRDVNLYIRDKEAIVLPDLYQP